MKDRSLEQNILLFDSRFMSVIFFICSIMVVGIHSYNATGLPVSDITSCIEGFFCHGLFIAAVPIFFYLSGYLFFRNMESAIDVFKKMRTRVKSVLMPFLAWSSFYFLFYFLVSSAFGIQLDVPIVLTPLNILKYIVFYRYSFVLWYMFQLVIYILLAPIIFLILKKRSVALSTFIVVTLFSIFIKDSIGVEIFSNEIRPLFQFDFFCYYLAGCVSVKFTSEINKLKDYLLKNKKLSIVLTTILLIIFSFLDWLVCDGIIQVFYARIFVPIVAILLFVLVGLIYQKIPYPKQVSTMIVYGIHSIMGRVTSALLLHISPYVPVLVLFVITMAICSVLSCLFAYILKRFFKPIYFVLSGGR